MTAQASSSYSRPAWLLAAQGLWVAVTVLVVGLYLLNLPYEFADLQILCSGAACASGQLSPADLINLRQTGLSLGFFAGYQLALNAVFFLVFVVVGALIFWRRSNDGFGIFAAFTMVVSGFSLSAGGPPPPAIVERFPALLVPIQVLAMLGGIALVVFLYLFPDGHFAPRWMLWLVPLVVAREAVNAFRPDLLVTQQGSDWTLYPEVLSAIFALVYRYWRVSGPIQRQQTKWAVYGSIMAGSLLLGLFFVFSAAFPSGTPGAVVFLISSTAWWLTLSLIPVSLGMAILRSHLWDIDIVIRRTLIYGVLTGLLAVVYLVAVVALQTIFTALTGAPRSELVTVLSTLVIAALFVPLRHRLQTAIDQRFYRHKYDAARTLAKFGATLRDEVDLDALSAHLVVAVDETMQPESVGLWLAQAGERRTTPDHNRQAS